MKIFVRFLLVLLSTQTMGAALAGSTKFEQDMMNDCGAKFLNIAMKMALYEQGTEVTSEQSDVMLDLLRSTDPKSYAAMAEAADQVCSELQKGIKEGTKK